METLEVPLREIKTHPALQPRDLSLVKLRDQPRLEAQSDDLVRHMAELLKASSQAQLAPLYVADVEGVLYVVDGHHRLRAYKRAKRETVPAHVKAMTLQQASHASKVANLTHTKLPMHPEQLRNACWHYLAHVTREGGQALPQGISQRSVAARFGITLDTVQRMLAKLPEVAPKVFPEEHLDAITGWPHWRYVRSTARNEMYQQMTPEVRLEWQAGKYAKALAKLWDRYPPEVCARGHALLREQAGEDQDPTLIEGADEACWSGAEGEPWAF